MDWWLEQPFPGFSSASKIPNICQDGGVKTGAVGALNKEQSAQIPWILWCWMGQADL